MAKEAIEQVKLAEEKASQILLAAEQEAADMLTDVGKQAQSDLDKARSDASSRVQNARDDAKKCESELLAKASGDIEQLCTKKREAMLGKKEMIISRILDAVVK